MKKLLLIVACFVFLSVALAQSDKPFAYAHYQFTHLDDTTQKHFPRKEEIRLYLGKEMSCSVPHGTMTAILKMMQSPDNASLMNDLRETLMRSAIFKEPAKDKATFVAPAGLTTYLIEEKIPEIQWNIEETTKDIKGYTCQKATTLFRGRQYEAWFCPSLPYNNGPWKLGGLPGLILEAYDVNKDVLFEFVAFAQGSDIESFSIPTQLKTISQKEYDRYHETLNKDVQAMRGASTGGNVYMGVSSSKDGGPPKRIKIINNPLEKQRP